jgi:hypothetical protein
MPTLGLDRIGDQLARDDYRVVDDGGACRISAECGLQRSYQPTASLRSAARIRHEEKLSHQESSCPSGVPVKPARTPKARAGR